MYSCAIRSSSSVVTPGATALPASTSAPAAIRPATRIFSITSGVCAQGSVPSLAVGLPTYSGRAIHLGTDSVGDNTPGESAVRAGMTASLVTPARRRCGPWQRPEEKPGNQTQPGDDAGRGSGPRRSRAIRPSPATMRAVAAARGEAGQSDPARRRCGPRQRRRRHPAPVVGSGGITLATLGGDGQPGGGATSPSGTTGGQGGTGGAGPASAMTPSPRSQRAGRRVTDCPPTTRCD